MDVHTLGYVHDLQFRELISKQDNELIKANVYSAIKLTKTGNSLVLKVWRIRPKMRIISFCWLISIAQVSSGSINLMYYRAAFFIQFTCIDGMYHGHKYRFQHGSCFSLCGSLPDVPGFLPIAKILLRTHSISCITNICKDSLLSDWFSFFAFS